MNILYAKFEPTNRQQRRLLENEFERILPQLCEVEFTFLVTLFSDDFTLNQEVEYEDLYLEALNMWNAAVDWLKKYDNLEHHYINEKYFTEQFKPLEKYVSK